MAIDICDMTGKVALVTGASTRGIGGASAKLLAAHGAKVVCVARREERLQAMVESIKEAGGEAAYAVADVSCEEDCAAAVQKAIDAYGRLDAIVLSSGMSGKNEKSLDDVFDTDEYRRVLGVNMDGIFFMMKYAVPHLIESGAGSAVFINSMAGFHASGHAPYTASKGALRAWTNYFAKKLAPHNVRVNGIAPGLIDTEMTHPVGMDELFEKYVAPGAESIPLGRLGQPEDIANGVLYLASPASSWVTGHNLVIDGGELA